MSEIIGNIIRIIDEYQVIINLGKEYVKKGSYIYVYDKNNSIKDLDGAILGTYDFFKAKLTVTEVHDKFSICESYQTNIDERLVVPTLALSPLLERTTIKTKLNIESSTLEKINNVEKAIHVGDIVKLD